MPEDLDSFLISQPTLWLIAGVVVGLMPGSVIGQFHQAAFMPFIRNSGAAVANMALLTLIAGGIVSGASGLITSWIARLVSRGRRAAVVWVNGITLVLFAVSIGLLAQKLGGSLGVLTALTVSFIVNAGSMAIGAVLSLILPPRSYAPVNRSAR